jgi:hypothetical protein
VPFDSNLLRVLGVGPRAGCDGEEEAGGEAKEGHGGDYLLLCAGRGVSRGAEYALWDGAPGQCLGHFAKVSASAWACNALRWPKAAPVSVGKEGLYKLPQGPRAPGSSALRNRGAIVENGGVE